MSAWTKSVATSRQAYATIISILSNNRKVSKEMLRAIRSTARSILPNATETKIVVTANARAIRHFLNLRGAIEGDVEMRRVSKLIYEMMMSDAPTLVSDFRADAMADGSPVVVKS
jgi:thymidylate synthase (FAD)